MCTIIVFTSVKNHIRIFVGPGGGGGGGGGGKMRGFVGHCCAHRFSNIEKGLT